MSHSRPSPSDSSDHQPELFALEDGLHFMKLAAQALSQDEFSRCFEPKPVRHCPDLSLRSLIYMAGVGIRYGILFPIRLSVLMTGAAVFCSMLPAIRIFGCEKIGKLVFLLFCKVWLFAMSAWARHHGEKPRPHEAHIFVANHTSFVDFFLLSSWEFCHATVAQVHGGLFGLLQRHALHLNGSLFFYRDESRDREKLTRKMKEHTDAWKDRCPLLIFPEGTCVNNEYTVLFHKGSFELGCAVCPVAIKYNKRLLDPYWNTREQSFTQHLFYLMTRWCMVADVWWLPPQKIEEGETSIEFANRVKDQISRAASLKNLSWNGYLKNYVRQQDRDKLQKSSQKKYGAILRKKIPLKATEANPDDLYKNTGIKIGARRRSVADSLFEPQIHSVTLTDLRNEILVSTPPSRSNTVADGDCLARSWKHHSVVMRLNSESGDEKGDRAKSENEMPAGGDEGLVIGNQPFDM